MAPPVEAAPTDPDVVFAIGSEVLLEGLVNKPQLNGRFGEIVSVLSNGRFGVRRSLRFLSHTPSLFIDWGPF